MDHYLSSGAQRRAHGAQPAAQELERLHELLPTLERTTAESDFIRRIMDTQSYGFHQVHVIEVSVFTIN